MASIPEDLLDAHELLYRYGRWAMDRHHKHRCASAEGLFVPPPEFEDRGTHERLLAPDSARAAHRALIAVPLPERQVLQILYIPQRIPAAVQLRMLRIPARTSKERHLSGMRMFWARHMQLRHNAVT